MFGHSIGFSVREEEALTQKGYCFVPDGAIIFLRVHPHWGTYMKMAELCPFENVSIHLMIFANYALPEQSALRQKIGLCNYFQRSSTCFMVNLRKLYKDILKMCSHFKF